MIFFADLVEPLPRFCGLGRVAGLEQQGFQQHPAVYILRVKLGGLAVQCHSSHRVMQPAARRLCLRGACAQR